MERKCINCNNYFKTSTNKVFCSKECHDLGYEHVCDICGVTFRSNSKLSKHCGSSKCMQKARYKDLFCEICGKGFRGRSTTRFCSIECKNIYLNTKDLTKLTCYECGIEFVRSSVFLGSGSKNKHYFCSKKCSFRNSMMAKYGTLNRYSTKWSKLRKSVLDYYGNCCVVCGSSEKLNVHHCIPKKYVSSVDIVNNFEYLIPLCPKCHIEAHRKNDSWFKDNFNDIESKILNK